MSIDEYFGGWAKVIDLNEAERIVRNLSTSPTIICPSVKNIFRAFHLCPFNNLQVVILSFEPYADIYKKVPKATGIAFANSPDTPEEDYSPSLEILRESVIDYTKSHGITIFDPSLEKWEEQGVLLLNSALSCQAGKSGSHSLMWRPFTCSLLTNLSKHAVGIVYVLMGVEAQSFEQYIDKTSNYVIRCRHPSYYARTKTRMSSDIWKQVNDIIIGQRGYGIKWFEEETFSINQ